MAKAKKESAVLDPACAPEWTDILRQMLLIRRFEEATEREFRKGKIGGYLHVYIGQEAVASGIIGALQKDDIVFCGYRDHAQALALGSDPGRVMAELFGKGTGVSKGKGGSMHMYSAEHNLIGGQAIVGAQLAIATGLGFAIQYQDEKR
ncbi:MAG TPA: thiamine pyrophosphate-dependent enzyme, partial [Thermoanaerobaculia bacterium]|nr:thiamine pyrophosphate-dependent enzyme [Thermoanaerobaculia bacterium]